MNALAECAIHVFPHAPASVASAVLAIEAEERRRAANYPLSRYYLRPLAGRLANAVSTSWIRPWHFTGMGLLAALTATGVLLWQQVPSCLAAGFVLLAWFFDRADGQLARRQGRVSALGAWMDANVDELVDLGLHVVIATIAMRQASSSWPGFWLIAFLFGKYLLMYGLAIDEPSRNGRPFENCRTERPTWRDHLQSWYHLPGNADVRVHLLALAMATGLLVQELAAIAIYYNVRWTARYVLVARRHLLQPEAPS